VEKVRAKGRGRRRLKARSRGTSRYGSCGGE